MWKPEKTTAVSLRTLLALLYATVYQKYTIDNLQKEVKENRRGTGLVKHGILLPAFVCILLTGLAFIISFVLFHTC